MPSPWITDVPDANQLYRFEVSFRVQKVAADALESWLMLEALPASLWHHTDTSEVQASIYCTTNEVATALLHTLPDRLEAADITASHYALNDLDGIDWRNAWKEFFHAEQISPHIIVHPSWEPVEPPPGVAGIQLDPGMSFGTGLHGTTRACIHMLDALASSGARGRLIDAGCGSGILTLAALRLGFNPVEAFDIDPQSVADTQANLMCNGLIAHVREGDVLSPPDGPPADIIAANILAPVLHAALPVLLARLRPGGHLLLSGILTHQFAAIRDQCGELGLIHSDTVTIDEWTSGCFRLDRRCA